MPPRDAEPTPDCDVAIVGGGLAGMAAGLALGQQGLDVVLLESRSKLGGRASSFADPATGELLDFCQHVSMRCCGNLADFCQRLGIRDRFTCIDRLQFVDPAGRRSTVAASRWLPAPLHLGPSLLQLRHLSWRDRIAIARAMWRLMRMRPSQALEGVAFLDWLQSQQQSPAVIAGFWHTVLVSALADTLDRVSVAAARHVFVAGFLANRHGYEVLVPDAPLAELFGASAEAKLESLGAQVRLGSTVREISAPGRIALDRGEVLAARRVVVAVPWRAAPALLAADVRRQLPQLAAAAQLESSPITGIHLWFDSPITEAAHLVLVGCDSHWLFARGRSVPPGGSGESGYYYQVVISASRALVGADRAAIVADVLQDLSGPCPAVREAKLLASQIVTHREAVFSPLPGAAAARPAQRTSLPWLMLAGDWTQTHWPATMEGAVRSGYLAAEAVLESLGRPASLLAADQSTGTLARWLVR